MTIGMVLDYLMEYSEVNGAKKEDNKPKKATQADFDAF